MFVIEIRYKLELERILISSQTITVMFYEDITFLELIFVVGMLQKYLQERTSRMPCAMRP